MIAPGFWLLVCHMTPENWVWLFRPQALHDNIYTIIENPLEAVALTAEAELPWPVAILLGSQEQVPKTANTLDD